MDVNVNKTILIDLQGKDNTLAKYFQMAKTGKVLRSGKNNSATFVIDDGLLKRTYASSKYIEALEQIVVPVSLRQHILKVAHDGVMAGHLGSGKTSNRIFQHFYWPDLDNDVIRYCRSCDICQRTIPKGRVGKAPLGTMPIISQPFSRIALDLVGPLPITSQGNRYILTVVDYSSRYPEAVPLKNKESETVAEGLLSIYSRVGLPDEVFHDQGSEFMSNVMKQVNCLLSIKRLNTTPYHPMANGLNEKFNNTLKTMLKKMCSEQSKEWDRFLNPLLFAYRECPQDSTGYSPFELIYGRCVRGPLALLSDMWTGKVSNPDVLTTYEYVLNLKQRLEETCKLAQQNLLNASTRYKGYYNRGKRNRLLKQGDKVLLLLPTDNNKLLMQWKGPHTVVECKSALDYVISLPTGNKTFHINMLKKYHSQETSEKIPVRKTATVVQELEEAAVAVVELSDSETEGDELIRSENIHTFNSLQTETYKDVKVNPDLSQCQKQEVMLLLEEFQDVFTDVPNLTSIIEHEVNLTTSVPVKCRPYPMPYAKREVVKQEVEKMIKLGVCESSSASYAAPIVLVSKPDGSIRFCTNYTLLNKITVFDCEPMPSPDYVYSKVADCNYFTKIDMAKGYWQVPVREKDRDKTSFITPDGLYRYLRMPFGMINSSSTFNKLVKKLLHGLDNVDSFVDDILCHTIEWIQHLMILRDILQRLRDAKLSARPSKCFIGFNQIDFLGHNVGRGVIRPDESKVQKILHADRPVTKKQIRSFLGLVGFYRKFIPQFASISAVLTDMVKNGKPNIVQWSEESDKAFHILRRYLVTEPILHLPNFEYPFMLQTDASSTGIGAILLQEFSENLFPVMYASRKLLPRETRYSTIERECLAIVWGVCKFQVYLYGKTFILQTDHRPLLYLQNCKIKNGRLMRWALQLQPFRFSIQAIKGSQNVGADFLSRNT